MHVQFHQRVKIVDGPIVKRNLNKVELAIYRFLSKGLNPKKNVHQSGPKSVDQRRKNVQIFRNQKLFAMYENNINF